MHLRIEEQVTPTKAVAITYRQFNATGKRKEKETKNLILMTGNHGRFRFSE
jgi:hypothetical protein